MTDRVFKKHPVHHLLLKQLKTTTTFKTVIQLYPKGIPSISEFK